MSGADMDKVARFSIHYDGPIVIDHKLTLRQMSHTYEHMQRAIDRAYLVEKYGEVWKHARLKAEDYREVEFIAEYPREGGIFLDAVQKGAESVVAAMDRMKSAIRVPFERALSDGLLEAAAWDADIATRQRTSQGVPGDTPDFDQLMRDSGPAWIERYSNRSIVKEIDQLVVPIAAKENGGSTAELMIVGSHGEDQFSFNSRTASRFHSVVSQRQVGPLTRVLVRLRDLDRGNKYLRPKAKVFNLHSGREATLILSGSADFEALHPYHMHDALEIYACPLLEAGGFDFRGGDLLFIGIVPNQGG